MVWHKQFATSKLDDAIRILLCNKANVNFWFIIVIVIAEFSGSLINRKLFLWLKKKKCFYCVCNQDFVCFRKFNSINQLTNIETILCWVWGIPFLTVKTCYNFGCIYKINSNFGNCGHFNLKIIWFFVF